MLTWYTYENRIASKDQRRGHKAIESRVYQSRTPILYKKVRMCVDFRDLNKACPKDDFPLPHIDVLVDNTTSSASMSFTDGFSGYNQIKVAHRYMTKTTFTTE